MFEFRIELAHWSRLIIAKLYLHVVENSNLNKRKLYVFDNVNSEWRLLKLFAINVPLFDGTIEK